jgi:hypothetical protein
MYVDGNTVTVQSATTIIRPVYKETKLNIFFCGVGNYSFSLRPEDSRSSSQKSSFGSPKSIGILDDLLKNDSNLWCQMRRFFANPFQKYFYSSC